MCNIIIKKRTVIGTIKVLQENMLICIQALVNAIRIRTVCIYKNRLVKNLISRVVFISVIA